MARHLASAAAAVLLLAAAALAQQQAPDVWLSSLDPAAEPAAMAAAAATASLDVPWAEQTAAWDAQARAFSRVAAAKPTFVFFGDSITGFGEWPTGWSTQLRTLYGSSVEMINAGAGMGNTRGFMNYLQLAAMRHFNEDFTRPTLPTTWHNAALVTVCFGANDASTKIKDPTTRWIPVPEYTANYEKGIQFLLQRNVTNIILITPPVAAAPPRVDRRVDVTGEYAQATKDLAAKHKLAVADLYAAMLAVPRWQKKLLSGDGLHLSPAGNDLMYQEVLRSIRSSYPQVAPGVIGKKSA